MKPIFAKVMGELEGEVFLTRIINRPSFSTEFHFHTECQITYVVKSSGYKIVGDCIESFETGELTFLGSDIPHVWHNDVPENTSEEPEGHARSVALFFNPGKLTSLLSNFYNPQKLEKVLQTAKRGMKFYGTTKEHLKDLLFRMAEEEEGASRLILLLKLLEILSTTQEYTLLASAGYVNTYQTRDNERIDRVFKYIFTNFSSEIKLEEVAGLVYMNKEAFCRFFKMRTQKTLVEFINEIRIAHAIKMMSTDDKSIGSIAYECGYNSISNFNKFFKIVTNQTPSDFKKRMLAHRQL